LDEGANRRCAGTQPHEPEVTVPKSTKCAANDGGHGHPDERPPRRQLDSPPAWKKQSVERCPVADLYWARDKVFKKLMSIGAIGRNFAT
jgi:hypothetical protein